MSKNKLFKGACLAAVVGMIPFSQAQADVSISGWINQGVTYADDGGTSDFTSSADNGTTLGSRMTFAGSTDLANTGLTTGFEVILEPRTDADGVLGFGSTGAATVDGFAGANGDVIGVLGHSLFVSGNWGKLNFGLQSMPTDNIAVLADPSLTLWPSISPVFRGNGILLNGGGGAVFGDFLSCYTAPVLGNTVRGLGIGIDCNGIYRQGVRYDLPTFVDGLNIAVGWANDEVYDVAAKWNGELGRLKAVLHLGYAQNSNTGVAAFGSAENFQVQGGLMDPVTGLFGSVAYQNEDADTRGAAPTVEGDTDAYWLKVGIKKAFTSVGDTAIAFQYGSYNDQYSTFLGASVAAAGDTITGSELERIGFEVSQYFGSSLIIYGTYENLDAEADGTGASIATINNGDELDLFTLGLTYFY